MAIFNDAEEAARKESLKVLEDKRVAFAQRVKAMGVHPKQALYVQKEGGFHGIALCEEGYLYMTGPGPMDQDGEFTAQVHPSLSVACEDILIPSEGLGGIFGFGKKGGRGFKFTLLFPDGSQGDIEFVTSQSAALEVTKGKDPVLDEKRRRGYSNVVWDFKVIETNRAMAMKEKWLKLLGGAK